jgi:hypothetical protein
MPTIVLVDISRVGWAWMRGPQDLFPVLQRILPSTPFIGLSVFTTNLDSPAAHTNLVLAGTRPPETEPLLAQVARALNLYVCDSRTSLSRSDGETAITSTLQ